MMSQRDARIQKSLDSPLRGAPVSFPCTPISLQNSSNVSTTMALPNEQLLEWMEEGRLSPNQDRTLVLEPMLREGRSRTGSVEYEGTHRGPHSGDATIAARGGNIPEEPVSPGITLKPRRLAEMKPTRVLLPQK